MKFKVLRSVLTLSILLLFTTGASASPFLDVSSTHQYAEAIEYVYNAGIMLGTDTGNFEPTSTVTRGEMAAVICRLLAVDDIYTESGFFDCNGHWADGFIAGVASRGIVNGYGNGNFGPDDTVTYEQAVTMIIRALGYEAQAKARGNYPQGYLSLADSLGFLDRIRSAVGSDFTRAEIAQLVFNGRTPAESPTAGSDIPSRLRIGEYSHEQDTLTISEIHPDGSFEFAVSWYRLAGIGPATAYLDGDHATFQWEYYNDGDLESWAGYIDFPEEETVALTITSTDFVYASDVHYTVFDDFRTEREVALDGEASMRYTLLLNTSTEGWIQQAYNHGPIIGIMSDSFLRFYPDGTLKYWLADLDDEWASLAEGPAIYEYEGSYSIHNDILTIDGYEYQVTFDHGATFYLYLTALGEDPYHFADHEFCLETYYPYVWFNEREN